MFKETNTKTGFLEPGGFGSPDLMTTAHRFMEGGGGIMPPPGQIGLKVDRHEIDLRPKFILANIIVIVLHVSET